MLARLTFLLCLLTTGSTALGADSPLSGRPPALQEFVRGYCALLRHCGLDYAGRACSEPDSQPLPGVTYDGTRCELPRRLARAGIKSNTTPGWQAYGFLGRKYQLLYEISGRLGMRAAQFDQIMSHLRVSGKMLNQLLSSDFAVTRTTNRRGVEFVEASKGERFQGKARRLAGSITQRRLIYLGLGTSKILWWSFVGQALLDLLWQKSKTGETLYRIRVYVAPRTPVVNLIMDQAIFRNVLNDKIHGILDQLNHGVDLLQNSGIEAVGGGAVWNPQEWQALKEIAAGAE